MPQDVIPAQPDYGTAQKMVTQADPVGNLDNLSDAELKAMYSNVVQDSPAPVAPIQDKLAQEQQTQNKGVIDTIKQKFGDMWSSDVKQMKDQGLAGYAGNQLKDTGKGIVYGLKNTVRTGYNSLVDIADSVENFAASKGMGSGDLINQSDKISQNSDSLLGEAGRGPVSDTEKISQVITQLAAPIAGGIMSGGMLAAAGASGAVATAAGIGADATLNALLTDKNTENLSEMLKGTSVHEWPVVGSAVDFLATKPDDSEMTKRAKMFGETIGLGGVLAGGVWGLSRFASATKNFRSFSKGVAALEETASSPAKTEAVQSLEGGSMQVPGEKAPVMSEAQVAQSDVAVSSPETPAAKAPPTNTPEQLKLFEDEYSRLKPAEKIAEVDPATGSVNVDIKNPEVVQYAVAARSRVEDPNIFYTPTTEEDLKAAADILKNDPATLDRMYGQSHKDRLWTADEVLVHKSVLAKADLKMQDLAKAVVTNPKDPIAKINLVRAAQNASDIFTAGESNASAWGLRGRAEQVTGDITGMGERTVMQEMGTNNRSKMYQEIVNSYGGDKSAEAMANDMSFLSKLVETAEKPDQEWLKFAGKMKEVTRFEAYKDLATKTMINGLLSKFSVSRAMADNFFRTYKSAFDQYLMAATPGMKRSWQEANDYFAALQSARSEAKAASWSAFKDPEAAHAAYTYRTGDSYQMQAPNLTPEARAAAAGDGLVAQTLGLTDKYILGKFGDATTVPTRALVGLDKYGKTMNERALVTMEAKAAYRSLQEGGADPTTLRWAKNSGLDGKVSAGEFVEKYLDNPPDAIKNKAIRLGEENTNTGSRESMDPALSKMNAGVDAGVNFVSAGLGRVLQPFTKASFNAFQYAIENSPFAKMLPSVQKAFQAGGVEKDLALAKMMSGTTLAGTATYMAHIGMLTGSWGSNKEINKAVGNAPSDTSIQAFGHSVSLKNIEPLQMAANLGVLLNKASGALTNDQYSELAYTVGGIFAETMTPELMHEMAADLSRLTDSGKQGRAAMKDAAANLASKWLPYSGALTLARDQVDPIKRDTHYDNLLDMVKARYMNQIPGLSKDLPAQRDMFGAAITVPDGFGPDAISPVVGVDKTTMEIKKNYEKILQYAPVLDGIDGGQGQYTPKKPGRSFYPVKGGARIDLNPEQYSKYLQAHGGIDPKTGQSIDGGPSYKDMVKQVFDNYGFTNQKPADMGPAYFSMIHDLTEVDKIARQRSKQWATAQPDIMDNFLTKSDKFAKIQSGVKVLGEEVPSGR